MLRAVKPHLPRALVLAAIVLLGCKSKDEPERTRVTVLAAASLSESFRALEQAFEAKRPEYDIELSFAGSQLLASQLLEGAKAEVFASANPEQLDRVATGRTLIDRRAFASNRLVVVVPHGSELRSIEDLAARGTKVVLAGEAVPAGKYARVALDELGLRERVEANVVSNEDDVRGVIAKVSLGEADAGIAYATDLRGAEGKLDAIELPAKVGMTVRYELAVLGDAAAREGGEAFADFVTSSAGRKLLAKHGFLPAPKRP